MIVYSWMNGSFAIVCEAHAGQKAIHANQRSAYTGEHKERTEREVEETLHVIAFHRLDVGTPIDKTNSPADIGPPGTTDLAILPDRLTSGSNHRRTGGRFVREVHEWGEHPTQASGPARRTLGHNWPVNRVLAKVQSALDERSGKTRSFLSREGR